MPALRSARERARYFVTMRTAEALKHRTIKLMPVIHGYDLRMALASSLLGAIWYQIACVITDGAEPTKQCTECKRWFEPARSDAKTCSDKCRMAAYRKRKAR